MFKTLGSAPQPNYEGGNNLDLNDYNNYGDSKKTEEYYKKMLPSYSALQIKNPHNIPYYNGNYNNANYSNKDIEKLKGMF
jgi:hypothetical protein